MCGNSERSECRVQAVNQAWAGHPGSLVRTLPPPPGPAQSRALASQLWAKPLEKGAVAALFINGGVTNRSVSIHLSELNITASEATVTDIWAQGASLGATTGGVYTAANVGATDSAFLIFTPKMAGASISA